MCLAAHRRFGIKQRSCQKNIYNIFIGINFMPKIKLSVKNSVYTDNMAYS